MKLTMQTSSKTYNIVIGKHILNTLHNYIDTTRKIFILSDTNIPNIFIDEIIAQCPHHFIFKVTPGETSKSIKTYESVLQACLSFQMARDDLLIAIGGGVIGDLGGFVAASYLRGIDYVFIPTSTQAQVDSSIGGKVAINLDNTKNMVGSFYQPSFVFIDIITLSTLPQRHLMSGLVEALKAGLIKDPILYAYFKENTYMQHLEDVIYRSLLVKKTIVEQDEKEQHLRKILNFGHTIGHAIESYYNLKDYFHGECVAMGMPYFIPDETLKKEVIHILKAMKTYDTPNFNNQDLFAYILLDKKRKQDHIDVIEVEKVGHAKIIEKKLCSILKLLEEQQA
ncbi:MAG: 3-dehydroquinate synthase [Breznakia sp.]